VGDVGRDTSRKCCEKLLAKIEAGHINHKSIRTVGVVAVRNLKFGNK
jgi:hypothetical protein